MFGNNSEKFNGSSLENENNELEKLVDLYMQELERIAEKFQTITSEDEREKEIGRLIEIYELMFKEVLDQNPEHFAKRLSAEDMTDLPVKTLNKIESSIDPSLQEDARRIHGVIMQSFDEMQRRELSNN